MTPTYKIHSDAGNFRTFKALIAAEYCGVDVEVVDAKAPPADARIKKLPVLEAVNAFRNNEMISGSNAIAKFLAKMRADVELLGSSAMDSAKVDQWIEFCANNIELPASLWFYPVVGYMSANAGTTDKAKGDLAASLKILNDYLADETYLVGNKITLADITIVSALVYPFKFVADPKYREPFPHVMRWFDTCVNQPQFSSVIGQVVLAKKEQTSGSVAAPAGGKNDKKEKKEKKEKAPKEQKPKEEKKKKEEKKVDAPPADTPPPKKEEHIFKIMDRENPSNFSMDTWKKTYSNCADYQIAMNTFFEMYDPAGWSLWRGDYKYNDENKVLFMVSNLIGGFIQRTEEIRRWLFGTCTIRGVEGGEMKITHYFLIRGQEIEPLKKCNDDADCYEWTKVTDITPEFKKTLYDYWCSEGPLDGEACLDSRVYK